MITKINESLENAFWEYVSHEERINLFIIGDVENYGFETDFQDVWVQINDNKIVSVILRYYKSLIIYSYKNDYNIDEMINHINNLDIKEISGKKIVIDRLLTKYKDFKKNKETQFCSLRILKDVDTLNLKDNKIEKAEIRDLNELNNFICNIEDMYTEEYIESNTKQLKEKNIRIYFIKQDDKIVSTICTCIETSFLAMVCKTYTDINYRNQGLATLMTYTLSKELVNEGKIPCLFYSSEVAGKIYKKIGYEIDDNWSILLK